MVRVARRIALTVAVTWMASCAAFPRGVGRRGHCGGRATPASLARRDRSSPAHRAALRDDGDAALPPSAVRVLHQPTNVTVFLLGCLHSTPTSSAEAAALIAARRPAAVCLEVIMKHT
jgi:hypothetical protein